MITVSQNADVTPQQLDRYARLVYEKIGVTISAQKTTLLSNRLRRRLRALNLDCYDAYYELLRKVAADYPEWDEFLNEVTTHETYLFRDETHWNWLRNVYLPQILLEGRAGRRPKSLRVWSAACSTGDEATSIACCAADRLTPMNEWKIEVFGSDVGAGAVAQARKLTFGERAMRLVPADHKRRFFDRLTDGTHAAKPMLRELVRFETHNLLYPLKQPAFDLIFLKNVLIYFDVASKRKVLETVRRALKPGGMLVTGAAEGVAELIKDMESTSGWLHRSPMRAATVSGVRT